MPETSTLSTLTLINGTPTVITFIVGALAGMAPGTHHPSREQIDRVSAGIRNSGLEIPHPRPEIRFDRPLGAASPAIADLAVAVAILVHTGQMAPLPDTVFLGELGLDGHLRPTGHLADCVAAIPRLLPGTRRVIIPTGTSRAPSYTAPAVCEARGLAGLVAATQGRSHLDAPPRPDDTRSNAVAAKAARLWRGVAAAAAGGHPLLLTGSDPSRFAPIVTTLASLLPPRVDPTSPGASPMTRSATVHTLSADTDLSALLDLAATHRE